MKAIIIRDLKGRPLYIAKVEELTDLEFLKKKKECEANRQADQLIQDSKEESRIEEIEQIKKEIKILKGEE